ncbi:P-loop containing nucleoside triphosphate hydrolase protein [Artomyces pyxidatus]|uniref:P-loop containing nucleoside triphosphate hydrolase protein n=1 Tax=Artomyces pyxidatus TaxID=48021 RepID=A0ACB8T2S3_9AGAM|nr:P-loop containing nucleoside triphosphate hydrolase protein [Artomyces pyxidatus]
MIRCRVLEGESKRIEHRISRIIRVTFNPPYEGRFETTFDLVFYDERRKRTFCVSRSVAAIAGTVQDHQQFDSEEPYVRPSRGERYKEPKYLFSFVPTWTRRKREGRLPEYKLPAEFAAAVKNPQEYKKSSWTLVKQLLPRTLDAATYTTYFKVLLNLEEGQQQRELLDMAPWEVQVVPDHPRYMITMSDLEADNMLPELIVGDFIFLDDQLEAERWEGRVLRLASYMRSQHSELKIVLAMPDGFNVYHGDNFNLRLKLNRMTLRRMYHALAAPFTNSRRFLFPTVQDILPSPTPLPEHLLGMELFEENIRADYEQLQVVYSILHQPPGSIPFIIYGPPGTGKTATVLETILQLLKQNTERNILVCAPSNATVDHLTILLARGGLSVGDMFRLHAYARELKDCPEEVRPYTLTNDHDVFAEPPLDVLLKFRIVLCTCSTADRLQSLGVKRGHFSHIFIDEAAQAEEPLAMVPIMAMADDDTNVVLAGDPQQLGPVIKSSAASKYGLGQSYLGRLMAIGDTYNLETQKGRTIVKLLRNRRSHGNIIAWSNRYVYGDDLRAHAHPNVARSLLRSVALPKGTFPVVFHGIKGKEQRRRRSPSYFNIDEASMVKRYCLQLMEDNERHIDPADIGVITPYKAQAKKIKALLKEVNLEAITVGSVEQFQGQERRVIIFSTCRSNSETDPLNALGFVANRKRMNVALTRAQAMLVVIGDPDALGRDNLWRTFINYVHGGGGYKGRPPSWNSQDEVPLEGYERIPAGEGNYAEGEEFIDRVRSTILRYWG